MAAIIARYGVIYLLGALGLVALVRPVRGARPHGVQGSALVSFSADGAAAARACSEIKSDRISI